MADVDVLEIKDVVVSEMADVDVVGMLLYFGRCSSPSADPLRGLFARLQITPF